MSERRHIAPAAQWNRQLPYSQGVNDDGLIALSGQVALSPEGEVMCPGDIRAQSHTLVQRITDLLGALDARTADLVKLVVFYLPQSDLDENALRELLADMLGGDVVAVLTLVPLRELFRPGVMIELDAYAMTHGTREAVYLESDTQHFCDGLRCGEHIFVGGKSAMTAAGTLLFDGDLVSQNQLVLDHLGAVLAGLGASASHIVKANTWRAPPPSPSAYRRAAEDRFALFAGAPAVTGITIPAAPGAHPLIRMDCWAMQGADGLSPPRRRLAPADHWGWAIATPYSHGLVCGDWLFVGGQAALGSAAEVSCPGDAAAQNELTMTFVARVLAEAGAGFRDVVKINTYYCDQGGEAALQRAARERHRHFVAPGPASTAVPVDGLAYAEQVVEIEAIARLRQQNN